MVTRFSRAAFAHARTHLAVLTAASVQAAVRVRGRVQLGNVAAGWRQRVLFSAWRRPSPNEAASSPAFGDAGSTSAHQFSARSSVSRNRNRPPARAAHSTRPGPTHGSGEGNQAGWKWRAIPVGVGIAFLGGFQMNRIRRRTSANAAPAQDDRSDSGTDPNGRDRPDRPSPAEPTVRDGVRTTGPWQVRVLSTLPLKAFSRLWGRFNEIDLPVFLRAPGFRLYAWLFGVNLAEVENDLATYPNLASFFYRRLKPGSRPSDPNPDAIVSPADGRVIQFGVIKGGEVEQVKGMTYRIDALLGAHAKTSGCVDIPAHTRASLAGGADVVADDHEFARLNGISYTLPEMLSGRSPEGADVGSDQAVDVSIRPSRSSEEAVKSALKPGPTDTSPELQFCVIYLAPGDYHRFHSPVSWVVERRRHFVGELFSVSPTLVRFLPGLFTLNERVVLLGRWRYGFFSLTPVGATNVGSIRINFDADLRTNSAETLASAAISAVSNESDSKPADFDEGSYHKASPVLGGYPLRRGDEVGGFRLGSTVVVVFEAPVSDQTGKPNWNWTVSKGQKVKVGEALGYISANPECC